MKYVKCECKMNVCERYLKRHLEGNKHLDQLDIAQTKEVKQIAINPDLTETSEAIENDISGNIVLRVTEPINIPKRKPKKRSK